MENEEFALLRYAKETTVWKLAAGVARVSAAAGNLKRGLRDDQHTGRQRQGRGRLLHLLRDQELLAHRRCCTDHATTTLTLRLRGRGFSKSIKKKSRGEIRSACYVQI